MFDFKNSILSTQFCLLFMKFYYVVSFSNISSTTLFQKIKIDSLDCSNRQKENFLLELVLNSENLKCFLSLS
jgi:hypothetical protein